MDFNGGNDDKPLDLWWFMMIYDCVQVWDFTTFWMITNDWLVRCWTTSTHLDGYKFHWKLSWINVPDDCGHMAYRQWCPFTRSCYFPSNVSGSDFVPDVTTGRSRCTSHKMSRCGFHWGKVHSFTNQKFRFLVLQSTKQHSPSSVQHPKDTVKCWSNVVTLWWTNIAMENGHWNSGFSHEKWWIFPWQNVSSPGGKIWFHIPPDTKYSRTPRSRRPVADRPAAKFQAEANAPNRFRNWDRVAQPVAVLAFLAIGISFCVDEDPNFTTTIGCVWKCRVPHCTQWFCWSLSLWKIGYFIGNINPTFSDKPNHQQTEKRCASFSIRIRKMMIPS